MFNLGQTNLSNINQIYSSLEDCSVIGRVVKDCKEYMSEFHSIVSIVIRHFVCEANGIAYRLAYLAS